MLGRTCGDFYFHFLWFIFVSHPWKQFCFILWATLRCLIDPTMALKLDWDLWYNTSKSIFTCWKPTIMTAWFTRYEARANILVLLHFVHESPLMLDWSNHGFKTWLRFVIQCKWVCIHMLDNSLHRNLCLWINNFRIFIIMKWIQIIQWVQQKIGTDFCISAGDKVGLSCLNYIQNSNMIYNRS
jgi:hypothetical protein